MANEVPIRASVQAWARACARAVAARVPRIPQRRSRKLLLVHLDGVPLALLEGAMASGRMPFLSRLLSPGGGHVLAPAFWGSPASTPAFQAGVLYGLRHPNLPAYNWFDRGLGREVRMNAPRDAVDVERRVRGSHPESLLAGGGTTYLSLFRAEADNLLCMTGLAEWKALARALGRDVRELGPTAQRSSGMFLRELFSDTLRTGVDAWRWSLRVRSFRHERQYWLNRFFMMQLGWQLAHSRALVDMVRGVPAIYLVFGNYDEVAHRRGPRSPQALEQLYKADGALEALHGMARTLEEPYDVVLVTDHGHVDSVPFEERTGRRLQAYLFGGPVPVLPGGLERQLLDGRTASSGEEEQAVPSSPVVIEAGNFSHVYLSRGATPLEAAAILARHRDVLSRAAASPHIGLVALRLGTGAVALVQGEAYTAETVGRAPLHPGFNPRAVEDLLRELPHMPTAGDLVLYGQCLDGGATVGFAWEFGSHGGLTRTETESLVAWPAAAPLELAGLGHSTQLHARLSDVYRGGPS
jgi:hypothetical protein